MPSYCKHAVLNIMDYNGLTHHTCIILMERDFHLHTIQ